MPLSPRWRFTLKALVIGVCALLLCITPVAAEASSSRLLERKLERHLATIKKDESVVRFFTTHEWLLSDPRFEDEAERRLRAARMRLERTRKAAATTRTRLRETRAAEREAALHRAPPRKAICAVFGQHCEQALVVAHCESRFDVNARNGQYLGLFQMGSWERARFGHGSTAYAQAQAAHRYFVLSGRDWSPWSCKPW